MEKMKIIIFICVIMAIAAPATAADAPCPAGSVCLKNPLAPRGINEPADLVIQVIQAFAGIMGTVAIAWIVFCGFKMVVATNEESIKSAREGITWSVLGFAISILSFTIISGAAKLLGFEPGFVPTTDVLGNPVGGLTDARSGFIGVMWDIMKNFLGLIGFAATLMILYYGFKYMTAAGNEEAVEQAKTGLRWTVTGLVVVLLAFTIIASVQKYLLKL